MINFDRSPVVWAASPGLVDYPFAVAAMEERVGHIRRDETPELVWLLEHPPLYTAGTGAQPDDLKDASRFPVFATGRGGQYTYHGPGQRIAYVMVDIQRRFGGDVRAFVASLETWIMDTLREHGIPSETHPGRVGVWTGGGITGEPERKIAAIGIRVRRGVSYHGISLNIAPDLTHYEGIVPCGLAEYGVTSLADLGRNTSTKDVDMSLRRSFERIFGPTEDAPAPASGAHVPNASINR